MDSIMANKNIFDRIRSFFKVNINEAAKNDSSLAKEHNRDYSQEMNGVNDVVVNEHIAKHGFLLSNLLNRDYLLEQINLKTEDDSLKQKQRNLELEHEKLIVEEKDLIEQHSTLQKQAEMFIEQKNKPALAANIKEQQQLLVNLSNNRSKQKENLTEQAQNFATLEIYNNKLISVYKGYQYTNDLIKKGIKVEETLKTLKRDWLFDRHNRRIDVETQQNSLKTKDQHTYNNDYYDNNTKSESKKIDKATTVTTNVVEKQLGEIDQPKQQDSHVIKYKRHLNKIKTADSDNLDNIIEDLHNLYEDKNEQMKLK